MNKQVDSIYKKLKIIIPNPVCELNYNTKFQLLVAIILSAQCTDKRVNEVTNLLFTLVEVPDDIVELGIEQLEKIIKPCGFYHSKAKNIFNTAVRLNKIYNGQVPNSLNELITLPGVGRKTASVLLGVWSKIPTMPVDTHVFRVSNRLGIVNAKDVLATEMKLREIVDENKWIEFHHLILLFGRYYCKARKPNCENCPLKVDCEYIKGK